MSTIKSSAEHLTLNADGASKDIKFQANGVEKASISSSGAFTSTTIDATALTGNLPAISGAALTNLDAADVSGTHTNFTSTGIDDNADATAITIDSSERVLINKTAENLATVGAQFRGDAIGLLQITRDGGAPLHSNRLSSAGDHIIFYKDTTAYGRIGISGDSRPYIAMGDTGVTFVDSVDAIMPFSATAGADRDDVIDLGYSTVRFDDVYATNGTIQTSDRNEKQDIEALSVAETAVATACKGLMRKFRWKSAVAEKGDEARTHFGIIAQDLQDAFTAEGLDAGDYAMFISTTWWETQTEVPATEATEEKEAKDAYTKINTFYTLEEAPEGATERTRLGVRYPELLAFIISAT